MQSDIRYLHESDLAIAKEVVSICEKYGLRYYMLGGTMLGAIRHKGFIPWDDDMDLGMPRKDYERFLEVAPKELPSMIKSSIIRRTRITIIILRASKTLKPKWWRPDTNMRGERLALLLTCFRWTVPLITFCCVRCFISG